MTHRAVRRAMLPIHWRLWKGQDGIWNPWYIKKRVFSGRGTFRAFSNIFTFTSPRWVVPVLDFINFRRKLGKVFLQWTLCVRSAHSEEGWIFWQKLVWANCRERSQVQDTKCVCATIVSFFKVSLSLLRNRHWRYVANRFDQVWGESASGIEEKV